jgi:chromosome segregation ATPase
MFNPPQQSPQELLSFEEWIRNRYQPLLGREEDEDDSDDSDDDEDIVIEEDEGDTDDNDDEDDSSDVDRLKSELEKNKQELAAARVAARKAKAEAREARQKAASETGNWEQVAKEHEATIADLREELAEATGGKQTSDYELDQFKREVRVTRLASRLGFRDPADAIAMLKDDQTGDDKTAERALRQLGEDKPYLRDPRKASGIPGNGTRSGSGLSMEQLKSMSPEEINAAWDKGVTETLTRGG